jgi:hypothetical protein
MRVIARFDIFGREMMAKRMIDVTCIDGRMRKVEMKALCQIFTLTVDGGILPMSSPRINCSETSFDGNRE